MTKTLNQRIYETPGDIKKAIHDFGYEEGKQAAVEQIFSDIEKALDKHFTKLNYTDGTCTFVFHRDLEIELADIKKKYEVK